METELRHLVGKTTLSGYLVVRAEDEHLLGSDPGTGEREVLIEYEGNKRLTARLFRAGGKQPQLKLAYTGETGAAFRAWLRRRFPALKSSRYRGVLVLSRVGPDSYRAVAESLSQAEVELFTPGKRRHLAGARPVGILHSAMVDLEDILRRMSVPTPCDAPTVDRTVCDGLVEAGWRRTATVGGGLALDAGLRRAHAQLHLVVGAGELVPALVSLAAGFEIGAIDLGVLLIADGRLSSRLRVEGAPPAATLKRALREIELLLFLVRGPIVVLGIDVRRELR